MELSGKEKWARAEEEFNHAVDRKPNYLPAIFNLSILYDREEKYSDADDARRKYLRLDSKSGWANEVQLRLNRKTR